MAEDLQIRFLNEAAAQQNENPLEHFEELQQSQHTWGLNASIGAERSLKLNRTVNEVTPIMLHFICFLKKL